jgi:hypothetical protein
VDIIRRQHIEDNGTQENTGGEHRPDFKAHRRGHAAKGFQPWAVTRLSVTRLDEIKSPAAVRGFFVAMVSSPAAFSLPTDGLKHDSIPGIRGRPFERS